MTDLDTLNGLLSDIATDAAEVASQHTDLVNQLQSLQQQIANNQPVDLTSAIAAAQSIKTTLDGIAQTASTAPTTTSSGSGTTGDATTTAGADAAATDTSGTSDGSTTTQAPAA